jgi:large subunit ribosomal protein L29
MALPKIEDVRKLSDEEINDEILSTKKQLFQLRLQQATRRLEKFHEFKHTKHRLGQLLTVEGERLRENAQKASEQDSTTKEK